MRSLGRGYRVVKTNFFGRVKSQPCGAEPGPRRLCWCPFGCRRGYWWVDRGELTEGLGPMVAVHFVLLLETYYQRCRCIIRIMPRKMVPALRQNRLKAGESIIIGSV